MNPISLLSGRPLDSVHTKSTESDKSKMPLNPASGYAAAKGHNREGVAVRIDGTLKFVQVRLIKLSPPAAFFFPQVEVKVRSYY